MEAESPSGETVSVDEALEVVCCRGRVFDSHRAAQRASVHPNGAAITYIDYEQDWAGVAETLTWSQLYRRMLNVAEPLRHVGATGDRAVILAPQGIEYVVGFLGALQAGRIAVPLPVPHAGAHDERTISVLSDTSPAVILTTSGAVDDVRECAQPQPGQSAPSIVELDLLDLDSRQRSRSPGARPTGRDTPETAYLQYTSGSTRTPAGVMVSNKNVFANFEQIVADFFAPEGASSRRTSLWCLGCRCTTTWVFY